jgi:Raf kinase inhibitor-like YbhB/YbcL family protein
MAQANPTAHSGAAISILRVDAYEHIRIPVVSSAVGEDGRLDPVHAADGDNTSPPLEWTAVAEADTYVLIVEDPDAPQARPVVHWVVWDIPGSINAMPANLGSNAHPDAIHGATQGLNSHGETGWMGMAPPPGGGVHRYHFQLFGVSKSLGLRPDTPLEQLVEALKGCTMASGELVALYERPEAL